MSAITPTQSVSPSKAYSHFDSQHWTRVKSERTRLGLARNPEAAPLLTHPLLGKSLVDNETGVEYQVESVRKDWFQGYFISAELRDDKGSHRTCCVGNISSVAPDVLRGLGEFADSFSA